MNKKNIKQIITAQAVSNSFAKSIVAVIIAVTIFIMASCTNSNAEKTFAKKTLSTDERFAMQKETDADLWKKYKNGKYTLAEPLVVVNPYGLSPLTALVIFETKETTQVSVRVHGKDEYTTVEHKFSESSKKHSVPIYGLYAGTSNTVDITATHGDKSESITLIIETEPLPSDISRMEVAVAKPEKMSDGFTFFDCPHVNSNYALAIDSNGDVRWYLTDKSMNCCVMLTHLQNGNFLVSSCYIIPNSYNNLFSVFEVTPLGQFIGEIEVYGIHHDIREKSNGDLIFAANKEGRVSQNDYIVEIDRKTHKVLREWDLMEIIPMTEYDTQPPYSGGLSNWLHNNAIWYNESEDSFVISGRHQNMAMKFDAKTKKINWILSGTVGELNEKLRPYLLKPVSEDFEYPTSQHAAMLTPEGDLMLFDNRNSDVQNADGNLIQERLYSRVVRYAIDEKNMTVCEVWQYGKDDGAKLYSSFVSDVDYLGKNHYLLDFGGQYKMPDGGNYDHIFTPGKIKNASIRNSIVMEIDNDEVVFEATLTGNANSNTYKAERKNIYKNASEPSFYDWQ